MGVLCLSVCFSWLISGGVAPTTGPIKSPSLGRVKWNEMSVAETHEWNQVKDKDKVIQPLKQAFQFFLTDTTGFWVFTLWTRLSAYSAENTSSERSPPELSLKLFSLRASGSQPALSVWDSLSGAECASFS